MHTHDPYTFEVFENRGNDNWLTVTYDTSKPADLAKWALRHPQAYPVYLLCDDGGALCLECARQNFWLIIRATPGDGWRIDAVDTNYEDSALHCDHCNARIPSAYGEE